MRNHDTGNLHFTTDPERSAIREMQRNFVRLSISEDIPVSAGIHRIETHHRKDIPRAHLPAVVISAKSIWHGPVRLTADFAYERSSFVTASPKRIEICDMMTRFVSVPVHSDLPAPQVAVCGKASLVCVAVLTTGHRREEFVELRECPIASAHRVNESFGGLEHMPCIDPCVRLGIVAPEDAAGARIRLAPRRSAPYAEWIRSIRLRAIAVRLPEDGLPTGGEGSALKLPNVTVRTAADGSGRAEAVLTSRNIL